MKNRIFISSAACFVGLISLVISASAEIPAPGSKERKQLMNALRVPAKRDLQQDVIFKVEQLKVAGDWAFARVTPQRPDGKPIDYSRTQYREAAEAGAFDSMGEALLKKKNGGWKVVEWRFGATDTEVQLWASKYGVPDELFQ